MKYLIIFVVLLLMVIPIFGDELRRTPQSAEYALNKRERIAHYLAQFSAAHHLPCMVAGYQRYSIDGPERWLWRNQGWSDVENHVPCTLQTMMRVASVSKAIGSGLIATLVEAGKLRWEDDVNCHIGEDIFPKKTWNGSKVTITVRQLITHLSGLRTTSVHDLMHNREFNITNSTQIISIFANDPLRSKPDSEYYYSNWGWNLLGAIVEAIEKRPYESVIHDYMRQLGMTHAQMDTRQHLIANRARYYRVSVDDNDDDVDRNRTQIVRYLPAPITDDLRPFPHWPCGGVVANIDDLLAYGSAMLQSFHGRAGGFLKRETIENMWNYRPPIKEESTQMTIDGNTYRHLATRYVIGWNRVDFPEILQPPDSILSNLTVVYHVGEIGAANAIVAVFPEADFVFAAITNTGSIGVHLPTIATQVYHHFSKQSDN